MSGEQDKRRNMLVTTLGSYGDVYPLVGIANSLQQRGHKITLFTHEHYRSLADKYSLDCVCLDTEDDYQNFANHPDLFDPHKAFQVFMDTVVLPNIQSAYAALINYVQPGNTILISPMTVFAARLIQEKYGTPLITIHTIPMQIKSAYDMPITSTFNLPEWSPVWLNKIYWWVADHLIIDPLICPNLNASREKIGLKPVKRMLTRWVHSPDGVICLYPEWFAAPQPDWPPNTVTTGFPLFDEDDEQELPLEVQRFIQAGSPPVVFMPGSLMQHGRDFFQVSMQACEKVGCRAIFLSRYANHIPDKLPSSIKHFTYIPFSLLLPSSSVLVHHGGIGTMAQALRAGIPQLIHPMAYDQFDNAARATKLGVGQIIQPDRYSVETAAAAIQKLLSSPEIKQTCEKIATRFENMHALEKTSEIIEGLLPKLFTW